jgi:hypothetical protein
VLALAIAALSSTIGLTAASADTAFDSVRFAGGTADIVLDAASPGSNAGGGDYAHVGVLLWTSTVAGAPLRKVTLSARGLPIVFIDLTPIVDLFSGESEAGVRNALGLTGSDAALTAAALAASGNPAADTRRAIVRRELERHTFTDIAGVVQAYTRQRDLAAAATSASQSELIAMLRDVAGADAKAGLAAIMRTLQTRGLAAPILESHAGSGAVPHVALYVARMPASGTRNGTADVFAAIDDGPEGKVVALTLRRPPDADTFGTLLQRVTPFAAVLLTATVGYFVFRRQQGLQFDYFNKQQEVQFNYFNKQQNVQYDGFLKQQAYQQRRADRERFHQRKYENFAALNQFFSRTYPDLVAGPRVTASDLRNRLVENKVYSLLPASSAVALNKICDGDYAREDAIRRIDAIVRRRFREFFRDA